MPDDHDTPFSFDGQSHPSSSKNPPRGYLRGKVARKCEECGLEFETYHSQPRQFCTLRCSQANRVRTGKGLRPRNGRTLTCPWCRGEFYVSPRQADRRTYCSHDCATRDQARTVNRPCEVCGAVMVGAASTIGRFCSWDCYKLSQKPAKGRNCATCNAEIQGNRARFCSAACRRKGFEKPCESCGGVIYVAPHQKNKRYCSRACRIEGLKIKGPGCKVARKDGYIQVYYPTHPDATKSGYILEHRLVAGRKYGRRILPSEHVHHLDGNRANNHPDNLQVIAPGDHSRISNAEGVRKRRDIESRLAEYERRFGPLN